jgi:hypothetical protein
VNYYSKLVGWPIVRKREAKDAAIDLFEKLSSLEPPSDHLAHLLAALARTGRDGALVQDIEKATGILRRADKKDSANNDGLHYDNVRLLQLPRFVHNMHLLKLDEKQTDLFSLFFGEPTGGPTYSRHTSSTHFTADHGHRRRCHAMGDIQSFP